MNSGSNTSYVIKWQKQLLSLCLMLFHCEQEYMGETAEIVVVYYIIGHFVFSFWSVLTML